MKITCLLLLGLLAAPASAQSPRERSPEPQRRVERPSAEDGKAQASDLKDRVLRAFDTDGDGKLNAQEAKAARSAVAERRGKSVDKSGTKGARQPAARKQEGRRPAAGQRSAQRGQRAERGGRKQRGQLQQRGEARTNGRNIERLRRFRQRINEIRSNRPNASRRSAAAPKRGDGPRRRRLRRRAGQGRQQRSAQPRRYRPGPNAPLGRLPPPGKPSEGGFLQFWGESLSSVER